MAPRQDGEAPPCSPTAPEHARRGDRARPSNRRQAFPSTSRNCVRISHGSRMAVPARSLERVTLGLSAIVPLARIYVGAHLPIDVVGGSFFGSRDWVQRQAILPDSRKRRPATQWSVIARENATKARKPIGNALASTPPVAWSMTATPAS
jgi:hypothetical protein